MRYALLGYSCVILLATVCSAVYAEGFAVAAAKRPLNPVVGAYLAGYGPDRKASGQHDNLYLQAALIQADEEQLVIFTLDNIGLTRPDVVAVRAAVRSVLPEANVVFSSTHTHAGPDVVGIWGPALWRSGRDAQYLDRLVEVSRELAAELVQKLQPAASRVVGAEVPLAWVENVSEPELLDRRLAVMQFVDAEGVSLLTLTNFACHPTVLGPDNTFVSADYVAGFYQAMSAALPGEHMFLQGAIGGWVQPLQGDRSHQLALEYGATLAAAAKRSLDVAEPNPFAPLDYREREVAVPLDNWGFRVLMWLGVLERELVDGDMQTSVASFRLGGARFVTHPGETSPAFSLASRELLDTEHTFILGLTQDAMGYILKPEYFADEEAYPHAAYLTSVSAGVEAGPRIMAAIAALLDE